MRGTIGCAKSNASRQSDQSMQPSGWLGLSGSFRRGGMRGGVRGVRSFRRAAALFLAFAMVAVPGLELVPGTGLTMLRAYAAEAAEDKTITGLGVRTIANPIREGGGWSYVYYGKYYAPESTKYRVLDTHATEFGGITLLLDCERPLYRAFFHDDAGPNSNVWADSTVRAGLNGDEFLTREGNLTPVEAAAIAESEKEVESDWDGDGRRWSEDYLGYLGFTPLTGEKIFLLDAVEVTRPSYGYANNANNANTPYFADTTREKLGAPGWWLRSPFINSEPESFYVDNHAGYVTSIGSIRQDEVSGFPGVCPAFNVDLSSVLFSSLVAGSDGAAGAEYKLTLKDADLFVAVTEGRSVAQSGSTIRVPYTIANRSGTSDPTQISVLITDKAYTEDDAEVLHYGKLTTFGTTLAASDGTASDGTTSDGTTVTSGIGSFEMRSDISGRGAWGTDYHVYILAEDVNEGTATDYASAPVELPMPVESVVGITQASVSGKVLSWSATLPEDGGDVLVVAAWYSQDGQMIGHKAESLKAEGDTGEKTTEVGENAASYTLILLDGETQIPLCEAWNSVAAS